MPMDFETLFEADFLDGEVVADGFDFFAERHCGPPGLGERVAHELREPSDCVLSGGWVFEDEGAEGVE